VEFELGFKEPAFEPLTVNKTLKIVSSVELSFQRRTSELLLMTVPLNPVGATGGAAKAEVPPNTAQTSKVKNVRQSAKGKTILREPMDFKRRQAKTVWPFVEATDANFLLLRDKFLGTSCPLRRIANKTSPHGRTQPHSPDFHSDPPFIVLSDFPDEEDHFRRVPGEK
jgi:hypothetical protein